jgi:aromatic ring-opening dioxygenase catalytic subunit (LigB family)
VFLCVFLLLSPSFVSLAAAEVFTPEGNHLYSAASLDPTDMAGVARQPAIFLSHGGGPAFFMPSRGNSIFAAMGKGSAIQKWYETIAKKHVPNKPKAILVFSAHWEESPIRITSQKNPALYYDYYGFPDYTYQLTWPAPGNPDLAQQVQDLLSVNGIEAKLDEKRNLDHGVFIPLKLVYPDADIPVVQVSLNSNLDPQLHYKIGQAVAPLRDQGVLIVGSGQATHNMHELMSSTSTPEHVTSFCKWMEDTVALVNPDDRKETLSHWSSSPGGRQCHPREEHLIPLMVVAGAAHDSKKPGETIYNSIINAMSLHAFKFVD